MTPKLLFICQAPPRFAATMRGPTPLQNREGQIFYAQIAGITPAQFLDCVEAEQLFDVWPGKARSPRDGDYFDLQTARENARVIPIDARRVCYLGHAVARAFGHAQSPYFEPLKDARAAQAWCLPHPSPRNRWWNDPINREHARGFLRTLLEVR